MWSYNVWSVSRFFDIAKIELAIVNKIVLFLTNSILIHSSTIVRNGAFTKVWLKNMRPGKIFPKEKYKY